ncbi:MAG: YbaB/EbfC family nucleoid-associated protein [Clostridia bacterium]|nr:YbaB/EbfC family nucleoid-associated protein [Clostridia bacterium]
MKARLPEGVQMKRGDMMRQLQQMQAQMETTQTEVEETVFTATAGGGMVTAEVNGKKELISIKIDPEAVDPDDVEMLEDLVTAAVRDALSKASKTMEEKMGAITGGLNIPGMF